MATVPPSLDCDATTVCPVPADGPDPLELMHRLMHRLRSLQMAGLRALPDGLTPQEARVLGFFARRPGATQTDLAEHSGRDRGQITRLVTGLVDRGLLDKAPDPGDRRQSRLQLSPSGRQLNDRLAGQQRQARAAALSTLSAAEQQALAGLLQRILDAVEVTPG